MAYKDENLTPREADIEAHRAQVHNNLFVLSEDEYNEFSRLVETPLESTEKLERLATRESVFAD